MSWHVNLNHQEDTCIVASHSLLAEKVFVSIFYAWILLFPKGTKIFSKQIIPCMPFSQDEVGWLKS